jgi:hypothetical protein
MVFVQRLVYQDSENPSYYSTVNITNFFMFSKISSVRTKFVSGSLQQLWNEFYLVRLLYGTFKDLDSLILPWILLF